MVLSFKCRIWRDKAKIKEGKGPWSAPSLGEIGSKLVLTFPFEIIGRFLGYGFVNFTEHKHALACLQKLNNAPDVFSEQKVLKSVHLV